MTDKSMLVGTGSLSEKKGDLVKDFIEASNSGGITYSDGSLYLISVDEAMTSTLSRYELDEEGNLPEKPAATTKFEGTGAMMVKFADKNKLYVNQTFANSIVAVDAKTLKTTATIDLSEYLEDGAQMIGPGSSVIRDGKLFLSMGQLVDAQSMIGGPQASVAVIDVKTDKVEKVINSSLVSATRCPSWTRTETSTSTHLPPWAGWKVTKKAGFASRRAKPSLTRTGFSTCTTPPTTVKRATKTT